MKSSQIEEGSRPNRKRLHNFLCTLLPEPIILLFYAMLIGVVGGYGAVGFRKLIDFFSYVFTGNTHSWLGNLGVIKVVLIPMLGLLIVNFIVKFFAPEAKGHGVPEVMAAIAKEKGIIRPRVVLIKAVASALNIGTGGSVGREGPIVQIGSAFGSTLGQMLGLPERYLRLMIACGAGAGIAATFNAPIGGVMFATEVILGSFALQNFTAIVISSVVSASIGRIYLGTQPSFPMPSYNVGHFSVYWIYVVIGVLAGIWGFVYIKVIYRVEDWFDARKWPFWVKGLFGGAILGVIGIWFPQIFGVGYEWVDKALENQMALWMLVLLLFLKLLATSVTIASGGSGGVFSPGLYQGAMMGGAIGILVAHLMPHSGISPGAIAAMAMAGVFAGSALAPVTSIIMLFEMTNDYLIILPLMITSVLAATVTGAFSKESIYTWKLVRRGLDITRLRNPDRMKAVLVEDALSEDHLDLNASMTVEEAWMQFEKCKAWFAWVKNEDGILLGSVARAQVAETIHNGQASEKLESLLPKTVYRVDVHQTLAEALLKMKGQGVNYLLACRNEVPIGVIGSSDIIKAYNQME